MKSLLSRFVKDESGAALVEYGILVGLIAVVCAAAITLLGSSDVLSMRGPSVFPSIASKLREFCIQPRTTFAPGVIVTRIPVLLP